MTSRLSEADKRPLSAPTSAQQVTSGAQLAQIGCKLVIVFTVSGNLTIRTLDGVSTAFTSMPTGVFTFDVQHDTVTWTGTATAVSFFNP
jgi:hypothetical protein